MSAPIRRNGTLLDSAFDYLFRPDDTSGIDADDVPTMTSGAIARSNDPTEALKPILPGDTQVLPVQLSEKVRNTLQAMRPNRRRLLMPFLCALAIVGGIFTAWITAPEEWKEAITPPSLRDEAVVKPPPDQRSRQTSPRPIVSPSSMPPFAPAPTHEKPRQETSTATPYSSTPSPAPEITTPGVEPFPSATPSPSDTDPPPSPSPTTSPAPSASGSSSPFPSETQSEEETENETESPEGGDTVTASP